MPPSCRARWQGHQQGNTWRDELVHFLDGEGAGLDHVDHGELQFAVVAFGFKAMENPMGRL